MSDITLLNLTEQVDVGVQSHTIILWLYVVFIIVFIMIILLMLIFS